MSKVRGPLSESGYQTFDELKEMHKAYANAVEVATRYERERNAALARAEKSEREFKSLLQLRDEGIRRDYATLTALSAQVLALRGPLQELVDAIQAQKVFRAPLADAKKALSLNPTELGEAVQGVIEAWPKAEARLLSGIPYGPVRGPIVDEARDTMREALSALYGVMGRKG